ncbi:DUF309 domain-containing protein [Bacillus sp. AK031]
MSREYPEAYLQFLNHFHGDRDYFECHEVLEEYWKEVDPGNRKSVWVGLIQVAVGFYHFRRDNRKGAYRMISKGKKLLGDHIDSLADLGIDPQKLQVLLEDTLININSEAAYQSIDLPLIGELQQFCQSKGEHGEVSESLIHRHMLRDRSEVIETRKAALKLRQNQRD